MTTIRDRLAVSAAIVIVALTAAAFWLSYAHLHTVAATHGLNSSPARSWAWPATLDAFVVAGELLMLRASLARRTDWWAIGLTVTGSSGSIALNVFGVEGADPLAYVVAAVPPTAALLAFGALMRQIHSHLEERADGEQPATAPPLTAVTGSQPTPASAATRKTASPASATPAASANASPRTASDIPAATATPASASQATANRDSVYLPAPASPTATSTPSSQPAPQPEAPATSSPADTATPGSKTTAGGEQRDLDEVAQAFRDLRNRLNKAPSDAALATELGISRSRAQQLRTAAIAAGHTDLEKPLRAAS